MLSFLSLFVVGKERGISSNKVPKVRKDFIHTGRQTKNATEDESNLQTHACKQMKATCHTCLQASLHKHKAAGDNERQEENEESGQKITDEYCSKNRWMEIDIEQRRSLPNR